MSCPTCGANRGHLGGCPRGESSDQGRRDVGLSKREREALKQENAPPGTRRKTGYRQTKQVITGRTLKAQREAEKKAEKAAKEQRKLDAKRSLDRTALSIADEAERGGNKFFAKQLRREVKRNQQENGK